MNKNINYKQHIDILFIIGRIHKLGNKDTDHILPFLYFLSKSKNFEYTAKGFVYGEKNTFNYKNPLQKFLSSLKNVEIKFQRNNNFLSKIKEFLIMDSNIKFITIYNNLHQMISKFIPNWTQ